MLKKCIYELPHEFHITIMPYNLKLLFTVTAPNKLRGTTYGAVSQF